MVNNFISGREIAQPVKCLSYKHKNLNSSRRSQALGQRLVILVLLGKQKQVEPWCALIS